MGIDQKRQFRGSATLSAAAALFALPMPAMAQAATYGFEIPAQNLADALARFGRATKRQIVFDGREARRARSAALSGSHSAEDGLRQLLRGSGFTMRTGRAGVLIVEAPRAGRRPVAADTDISAPERTADTGRAAAEDEGVDIVVTAQKREERLIDTPQSVSVLSGDTLAKSGKTQFRDFADTIPGLSFQSSGAGQNQVSLRGANTNSDGGSTVGVYVDDVPYGSSSAYTKAFALALDVGLFDIDQVEILRGPQGTLWGASTMGGLIKYTTKKPDAAAVTADIQAGLSATRHGDINYNGAAAINLPIISDTLAVRASGFYSRDGGYIDNIALGDDNVNRSRVYGGRLDVLATPTDALSIRLTGFFQNIARAGVGNADYDFDRTPVAGALDQQRLVSEPFEQRFRLVSATIDYDLGPARLTSVSSFQAARTHYVLDGSGRFAGLLQSFGFPIGAVGVPVDVSTDKFTQEVRLASTGSNGLDWLVGGFYTHEKSASRQRFSPFDLSGRPTANIFLDGLVPSIYEEIAAFGDVTYHFSPKFDVSGGIRYARNNQRAEQIGSGLFVGSQPERASHEGVFTYLANARYHFSDRATAYVRYATGYRPGGPNLVANDPTTGRPFGDPTFQADHLKSYEIGLKAATADGSFAIDLAGYHIKWNAMQVNAVRNGIGVITNATSDVEIYGSELTLTARPARGVTVTGAFAYQDAKLADDDADLGGLKGDALPNVPKVTASVSGDYVMRDSAAQPSVGATVRFTSDRLASFDLSSALPQYRLPDYVAVDLRAGFRVEAIDVQVYLRNLFDVRGQMLAPTFMSPFSGPNYIAIIQPRTIGLSATAHF